MEATKAELLQVGIFFPHPFICMRNFILLKELEIEEIRPPSIQL